MAHSRFIRRAAAVVQGVGACTGLCMLLQGAHAQGMTERIERFSGDVKLQDQGVSVTVQTQLIPNRQKATWPAGDTTLLVEVRGGRLVADIDGKRQRYKGGDFWIVPPKATVVIETEDDSAALGITVIGAAAR